MDDKSFGEWLIRKRRYGPQSARDMQSRCRRIERIFRCDLDRVLQSPTAYESYHHRLMEKADQILGPRTNRRYAIGSLRTALKLYVEFLAAYR